MLSQIQDVIPTKEQLQAMGGTHLHIIRKRVNKEIEDRKITATIKKENEKIKREARKKSKEIKRQLLNKNVPFLSMPTNAHFSNNLDYLPYLLKQKWNHLFKENDNLERKFYVYAHIDNSKPNVNITRRSKLPGIPFYIGKGSAARAYDLNRNQGHGIKIKELLHNNCAAEEIVHIIKEGLTEGEALELESKLIYFFGTIYTNTRKGGVLYNLDMGKTPKMNTQRFIIRKNRKGIKKPTR